MPVWKLKDGIHIGEIIKPHSYLGRARVAFFIPGLEDILEEGSFLFIEWNEKPVPYQIEEINWQDDKSAIIKFADVNNDETASQLKKKDIYLPQSELTEEHLEELNEEGLVGYEVYNNEDGSVIGKVTDFIENELQSLLQIDASGKEILIPFHDSLILEISQKEKKIIVELPEGLLDL
jgi:16S rRNA processing protein RimM